MSNLDEKLRRDAIQIWHAGLARVDAERLVRETVRVDGDRLRIADEVYPLGGIRRIAVVGGGKAGAGMAAGLENALGPQLLRSKQVTGWINVPDDCLRPLAAIHLHAARPAGKNEPTAAGVAGSEQILQLVGSLDENDLCIVLLSGGGSALLPAPAEGITLADKLALTQHLSASGATIEQLNAVRKPLSRIKAGGLARACKAGSLVALIISDVLGDPLDVIASGPTVEQNLSGQAALDVLDEFGAIAGAVAPAAVEYLRKMGAMRFPAATCRVRNLIIGNLAMAVDAAGIEAERLGYSHAMVVAKQSEGPAEEIGRHLAAMGLSMRASGSPDCLISGGEPIVRLVDPLRRGLGGRNQQLALAALEHLREEHGQGITLLAAGTDGEDGPTDAAGAIVDSTVIAQAQSKGLDAYAYLRRNDAYRFFEAAGGLFKTGPTHTNVGDLRVLLVGQVGKTSAFWV